MSRKRLLFLIGSLSVLAVFNYWGAEIGIIGLMQRAVQYNNTHQHNLFDIFFAFTFGALVTSLFWVASVVIKSNKEEKSLGFDDDDPDGGIPLDTTPRKKVVNITEYRDPRMRKRAS